MGNLHRLLVELLHEGIQKSLVPKPFGDKATKRQGCVVGDFMHSGFRIRGNPQDHYRSYRRMIPDRCVKWYRFKIMGRSRIIPAKCFCGLHMLVGGNSKIQWHERDKTLT